MWKKYPNWIFLSILILAPLLVGLITFCHYGESIDEAPLYEYSNRSLQAYHNLLQFDVSPDLGKGNFRYYGPVFLMIASLITRLITSVFENINVIDAWHFVYFISFLSGVIGLYFIAKRWFSGWTSFVITFLFLSQPLIWGHAFINPKDIPFMSFCIFSVLTSLIMQEKLFPNKTLWEIPKFTSLIHRFQKVERNQYKRLIWFSLGFILCILIYLLGQQLIERFTSTMLAMAFSSDSNNISTWILNVFAPNHKAIPMEDYVPKGMKIINGVVLVLTASFFFKTFSYISEVFSQTQVKFRKLLTDFIGNVCISLVNPWVLLAGIVLGLTTSVRILGPALGCVALVISLYRAKSKAFPVFAAYFIISAFTTYLTWPYLWANPLNRFQSILTYMSHFPWDGKVLFNGIYYPTDKLPITYVPYLLSIQYTEPAIILFLTSLYLFVYKMSNRTINFEFAITTLLWGVLPITAFTVFRPALYDNTRQLLFIIPPLFLITGLSLDWVFQRIRKKVILYLVLLLMLLPGMYGIVDLHPYQYTYYNSFSQKFLVINRRFESDYWTTSFREAIEHLNQMAPIGSKIVVYGTSIDPVVDFSRADLIIDSYRGSLYDPSNGYDYAIITSRYEWDLHKQAEWQTIYTVQRDGVIFAVVKKKP